MSRTKLIVVGFSFRGTESYMIYRFLIMVVMLLNWQVGFGDDRSLTSQTKQFISISDIHFDPMSGCERYKSLCPIVSELIGADYQAWETIFEKYIDKSSIKYHHDTNYALFKSLLAELQQITNKSNPQFVLVLGDFFDHDLQKNYKKYSHDKSNLGYVKFVKKTMQFLTYKLNQTFPHINIYPALGNVDSYGNDYSVMPYGDFLHDLTSIWSSFIKDENNKNYFIKEFKAGGYYSVDISKANKIIVLDTVLFSPRSQNGAVKQAAQKQLDWLIMQLKLAKQNHQSVIITCHIPVGIDIYLSSTMPYKIIKNFWVEKYTTAFLKIMKEYSDVIMGILPGHVHIDLFQFTIEGKDHTVIPMIFTPSISPIFGNNPAIKIFNYNNTSFSLQSFERYYKPLSNPSSDWRKGNRFNGIHQTKCQYCYLSEVVQHLIMNNYLLDVFIKYYSGSVDIESDENDNLSYYWCSIYSNDMKTYKNCLNE